MEPFMGAQKTSVARLWTEGDTEQVGRVGISYEVQCLSVQLTWSESQEQLKTATGPGPCSVRTPAVSPTPSPSSCVPHTFLKHNGCT